MAVARRCDIEDREYAKKMRIKTATPFEKGVTITCNGCGSKVKVKELMSCSHCGLILFECEKCGWEVSYGE